MRLKSGISVLALLVASTSICMAATTDEASHPSGTFTLDHHAEVPGETLKAGEYSIRVVDQLADRMVLRVDNKTGNDHAIFLGVTSPRIRQTSGTGAVEWTSGVDGHNALRGFAFPSGAAVEFVYPKLQAVQLAKKNSARVVAIDPDSQELPKLKKMSPDDLKIVNLWALSLTTTGADKKPNAVLAERFQPEAPQPVNAAPASDAPVAMAHLQAPPPVAPAPSPRRATAKVLPKTASDMPLVVLFGLLFLLAAVSLRVTRGFAGRA